MSTSSLPKQPNILLLITDQQRTVQHFPAGWKEAHLRHLSELEASGVSFPKAITSTTPCGPSRGVIFSGQHPWKDGVAHNMESLDTGLVTLGHAMQLAGYDVAYKGKWHLSNAFDATSSFRPMPAGIAQAQNATMANAYGFPGWTSPDAGTADDFDWHPDAPGRPSASFMNTLGGGTVDNDQRFVDGTGPDCSDSDAANSILRFIAERSKAPEGQPFFLVASLVNPHDVFVYPNSYEAAGYAADVVDQPAYEDIDLPESFWTDNLATKPAAQKGYLQALSSEAHQIPGIGWDFDAQKHPDWARDYVRFYAHLLQLADCHTGTILEALRDHGLLEDTLVVRIADHGEMGLAHGGLRQKMMTMYQEAISVPFVFSHPALPQGARCEEPVSHVDLAPTLASIAGLDPASLKDFGWQGKDLSSLLTDPGATRSVNPDGVLFSYTPNSTSDKPTTLRGITDGHVKYVVYYGVDAQGNACSPQYELYDLDADPLEVDNLLYASPSPAALRLAATWYARLSAALDDSSGTPAGWSAIPPWQTWADV